MRSIRPVNVLFAVAILLPVVAMFAPKGFVILTLLAAVLVAVRRGAVVSALVEVLTPVGLLLALALAWAAAAALWSPDIAKGLTLWLSILVLFGAGFLLLGAARDMVPAERKTVTAGLMAGGVLFLALVAFEVATGGILTGWLRDEVEPELFNRGASVLALFMWLFAAAFAARFGRPWALGFIAASLAALFFLPMAAATLAAAAGAVVFLAVWTTPHRALGVIAIVAAIVILGAPFISLWLFTPENVISWLPDLPGSWQHRLYVWEFASTRITETPIFGWGFDASRAIPGGAAQVTNELVLAAPALPLHPHNVSIQVWLELGLPGIALFAAGAVAVILSLRSARLTTLSRAAAAAALVSWLVLAMLSFGIWQNWWLVVPWLFAVLFVAALPERGGQRS